MTNEPTVRNNSTTLNERVEKAILEKERHESMDSIISKATEVIKRMRADVEKQGYSKEPIFQLYVVTPDVKQAYEALTGTKITNPAIFSTYGSMSHHKTGDKAKKGKVLTWDDREDIPKDLPTMDVYVHTGALIYTDYKKKIVVKPEYKYKNSDKQIIAFHVSSSLVTDKNAFGNPEYKKIK